jgi:hypothetical protein
MPELSEWLNSVNFNKKDIILDEYDEKQYPGFIVNKCLSGMADAVLYANEMNRLHWLDKKMQYDFFLYGLPKKKRFAPWMKAKKVKDIDIVKQYYGYNNEKAKMALEILTDDQLDEMRIVMSGGGKK